MIDADRAQYKAILEELLVDYNDLSELTLIKYRQYDLLTQENASLRNTVLLTRELMELYKEEAETYKKEMRRQKWKRIVGKVGGVALVIVSYWAGTQAN